MSSRRAVAAVAAVLAVVAAGCGSSPSSGGAADKPVDPNGAEVSPPGDIPDNQAFVPYSPPGGAYSVKVPEGWSRTASGGVVRFTDKLNSIEMQSVSAHGPLTASAAKRNDVPRLAHSVAGFQAGDVGTVRRSAGAAVRITYLADAKPDAVTGKAGRQDVERYVFFHRGRRVVLTLTGPKGADNVDPWQIVTDSLRWTG